jgi:hypothetical protein
MTLVALNCDCRTSTLCQRNLGYKELTLQADCQIQAYEYAKTQYVADSMHIQGLIFPRSA